MRASVVTNHLYHTLQNGSCLQVFLYTDINCLIQDALEIFSQITAADPKIVIVPSASMRQKLEELLCQKEGASGFIQIGTLQQILSSRLLQKASVYDEISLTLALVELMNERHVSGFPFMAPGLKEDEEAFRQIWASKVATELLALESKEALTRCPEAPFLREELLKRYPSFKLPYEAFDLIEADFDQMIWIGFEEMSVEILKKLKPKKAQIFSLVPSAVFLGDILTPKQRLKELLKQPRLLELSIEHPILARFTKALSPFYQALIDLEVDYTVIPGELREPVSSLEVLQAGLIEGLFPQKLKPDDSLTIGSFASPYQECQWVINELQRLYQQDPMLNMERIAFVSSMPELYASILNGIGQTLPQRLGFTHASTRGPLREWLSALFFPSMSRREGGYFSEWILRGFQFLSTDQGDYQALYHLVSRAHFYTLGPWEGSTYLKKLKQQFLKCWFFDLELHERPFEEGLCEPAVDEEELERVLTGLNPLIDLLELVEHFETLTLSWGQWIEKFRDFVQSPFMDLIGLQSLLGQWLHRLFPYRHFKALLRVTEFLERALPLFQEKQKEVNQIKVRSLSMRTDEKIDFCFFVGLQQASEIEGSSLFFEPTLLPKDKKRLSWPLWIQRVKKRLYLSYHEGFLNKYEEGVHLWVESLQGCLRDHTSLPCLLNQSVAPKIKKSFLDGFSVESEVCSSELYRVDIRDVRRFLKDEESFIKSHFLKVVRPKAKLDAALFDFSLLQWKHQAKGQKASDGLFSFAKPFQEEAEALFFRSPLAPTQELRDDVLIEPPLKVALEDRALELIGLSSREFENKCLKKKEALGKLQGLKQFFEPKEKTIG